jgi:hypothetical protein
LSERARERSVTPTSLYIGWSAVADNKRLAGAIHRVKVVTKRAMVVVVTPAWACEPIAMRAYAGALAAMRAAMLTAPYRAMRANACAVAAMPAAADARAVVLG